MSWKWTTMHLSGIRLLIPIALIISFIGLQWSLYSRLQNFIKEFGIESSEEKRFILLARIFFVYLISAALFTLLFGFDSNGSVVIKYFLFYPLIIWIVSSISMFLFLILRDLLQLTVKFGRRLFNYLKKSENEPELISSERRKFLQTGSIVSIGLVAAPITTFGYAAIIAKSKPVLNKVSLKIPGLPVGLKGLKIAQVSDLHVNQFIGQYDMEQLTGNISKEKPDIIVITGDFVSNSVKYIPVAALGLKRINAPYGVYGCLGNHDYYTGAKEVRKQMESIGINILLNSSEEIVIRGEKLSIAGLDDLWVGKPDFDAALADTESSDMVILLSHNPDTFPEAANRNVNLTLSGHTHGGQVGVKLLGNHYSFVNLVTPYIKGEFSIGNSKLYVNRGIGTVGPPIRLNSTPEITIFTLEDSDISV